MSLDPSHLEYRHRRAGLDHDWFPHRTIRERPAIRWPDGKRVALWLVVPIEHFPLMPQTGPVRPTGALEPPTANLWAYANRDYGNRIGIHRIARALDAFGLKATAAVNATAAERYPHLIPALEQRGWEIMAHGTRADAAHHGGMDPGAEARQIARSLERLRAASSTPVTGWLSPGYSESFETLRLLNAQGIDYVADWNNDEMPYALDGPADGMVMLPSNHEISDRRLLVEQDRMVEEYAAVVLKAFERICSEAEQHGGGLLSLSITPWILGYPHRIAGLAQLLRTLTETGLIWNATGSEFVAAYRADSQ